MSQINSKNFITDNFLLNSQEAEVLYHEYAKDLPIIDYHNHLSAQQIAENKPVNNITNAWLSEDHYKWRGMRANGIEENFISGDASKEKKFMKWAETVPNTLRNPLFQWTQLELKRYFNIDEILQPNNALEIYSKTNRVLETKTPAQLLEQMKVEVICTTDDPTDDLRYHKQIAKARFFTKVYPTFRPDNLFFIGEQKFDTYIRKIEDCVNFSISNYSNLLKAIDNRIDFFHENGCKLSDYGISGAFSFVDFNDDEIQSVFDKNLRGVKLTELEIQVVEKVKRYIDKYGVKKVVCVFDGMPNKLKKETAYIKRYAKNELLNNRLNELYEKANFDVMPQPVHELMQLVIPLEYMYPKNTSERRIQEKQNSSRGSNQGRAWRSRSRRKKRTSRSW